MTGTKPMLGCGTKVVAGVTPAKEGLNVHGTLVYDTIKQTVKIYGKIGASVYICSGFYGCWTQPWRPLRQEGNYLL